MRLVVKRFSKATIQPSNRVEGGCRIVCRSDTSEPLVSIIVVTYHDREELSNLLLNLVPFRNEETELIIIDGGSRDGSLAVLRQNSDDIDFWLSEPDTGIYSAMNKGIFEARGKYILHINAGDRLRYLPLTELEACFNSRVDVVCCQVLEDDVELYIPRNDWLLRFDNTWHHQGTFYKRCTHLGYNSTYRVFADFEHNQRLRKANRSVIILDYIVATHRTDGASCNQNARKEIFRSIRSNFGLLHIGPAIVRFKLLKLRAWWRNVISSK